MDSAAIPDFEALIGGVARELDRRGIRFMLIGGQAVLLHGEPRLTQDVDITLAAPPSRASEIVSVCESLGLSPLPDDPLAFARRTFVLPAAEPTTRARVDFVFSTTPYEDQAISRAVLVDVGGAEIPYATAEDLILHKLFAGRPRDLDDVRGVVRRKGSEVDWPYVERWAGEFAAVEGRGELPELVRQLRDAEGPGR